MLRRLFALVTCVVALASSFLFATPDHPDPSRFATTFSNGRADVLPDGKVVINFDTTGQYRGLLTFNISCLMRGNVQSSRLKRPWWWWRGHRNQRDDR